MPVQAGAGHLGSPLQTRGANPGFYCPGVSACPISPRRTQGFGGPTVAIRTADVDESYVMTQSRTVLLNGHATPLPTFSPLVCLLTLGSAVDRERESLRVKNWHPEPSPWVWSGVPISETRTDGEQIGRRLDANLYVERGYTKEAETFDSWLGELTRPYPPSRTTQLMRNKRPPTRHDVRTRFVGRQLWYLRPSTLLA